MNLMNKDMFRGIHFGITFVSLRKRFMALAILSLVSVGMTAMPAGAQDPDWTLKDFDLPISGMTSSEMAYDTARDEPVLLTRHSGGGFYTWSWDGTSWTLLSSSGSFAFGSVQPMAFDQANEEMVLYDSAGNTWTWDGSSWSSVSVAGSPSMGAHMTAYDEIRQEVVVFGGSLGTDPQTFENLETGETWTWDGVAWSQAATTGPSPRTGGRMVFDSARGKVVLFGGFSGFGPPLGDTWEWDGTSWTEVVVPAPAPLSRFNFAMAFDPEREETILFGGIDIGGDENGNTWAFDGAAWTQISSSGPSPRRFVSMAYDMDGQELILFGGMNEFGVWPADTWSGSAILGCAADINGDGAVDSSDLGLLITAFGDTGASASDLNGDLVVNSSDLGILIGAFGTSCP